MTFKDFDKEYFKWLILKLGAKPEKTIEMAQEVDWPPKRLHKVLLNKQDYNSKEIIRKIDGNVAKHEFLNI